MSHRYVCSGCIRSVSLAAIAQASDFLQALSPILLCLSLWRTRSRLIAFVRGSAQMYMESTCLTHYEDKLNRSHNISDFALSKSIALCTYFLVHGCEYSNSNSYCQLVIDYNSFEPVAKAHAACLAVAAQQLPCLWPSRGIITRGK